MGILAVPYEKDTVGFSIPADGDQSLPTLWSIFIS
jgi:hypothetical protein